MGKRKLALVPRVIIFRYETIPIDSLCESYKFIEPHIADILVCPICLDLLKHPNMSQCGHIFCNHCSDDIPGNLCPLCRNNMGDFQPHRILTQIAESLHVQCQLGNDLMKCDWIGSISSYHDHLESCEYRECLCKSDNSLCSWKGFRKEISHHQTTCKTQLPGCSNFSRGCMWRGLNINNHLRSCPYEVVRCSFRHHGCNVSNQRRSFPKNHELKCLYRDAACSLCKWKGTHATLSQHNNECNEVVLTCTCSKRIKRGIMAKHKQSVCPDTIIRCKYCHKLAVRRGSIQSHNEKCEEYPVYCEFHTEGCDWEGARCSSHAHELSCSYRTVDCPYCSWIGTELQFKGHTGSCRNTPVKCSCKKIFRRSDLFFHRQQCPNTLVKCQFCNSWTGKQLKYTEHKEVCLSVKVKCSNAEYGCDWTGYRSEKRIHNPICRYTLIECTQCHEGVRWLHLKGHLIFECSRRKAMCMICGNKYPFFQMNEHRIRCRKERDERISCCIS